MKRQLHILLIILWTKSVYSQTIISESIKRIDTTYYQAGQIKTITFTENASSQETYLEQTSIVNRKIKTIYQYDECNNLRNTAIIYEVNNDPKYSGVMNPDRQREEDNLIKNVICDKQWMKPIIR
jgi:hypothetical protein